LTLRGLVLVSP